MKKAFAWLEGNRIEYTFHDYKKSGVPARALDGWIKQAGWERAGAAGLGVARAG